MVSKYIEESSKASTSIEIKPVNQPVTIEPRLISANRQKGINHVSRKLVKQLSGKYSSKEAKRANYLLQGVSSDIVRLGLSYLLGNMTEYTYNENSGVVRKFFVKPRPFLLPVGQTIADETGGSVLTQVSQITGQQLERSSVMVGFTSDFTSLPLASTGRQPVFETRGNTQGPGNRKQTPDSRQNVLANKTGASNRDTGLAGNSGGGQPRRSLGTMPDDRHGVQNAQRGAAQQLGRQSANQPFIDPLPPETSSSPTTRRDVLIAEQKEKEENEMNTFLRAHPLIKIKFLFGRDPYLGSGLQVSMKTRQEAGKINSFFVKFRKGNNPAFGIVKGVQRRISRNRRVTMTSGHHLW